MSLLRPQDPGSPSRGAARVGVVVPLYNGETYVRETLDSVLAQSYPEWRCVVVDDGSTDGSGDVADSYARQDPRFTVVHQKNAGLPAARNRALRELGRTVDLVALLDADDTWLEDALAQLVGALERDPTAVGAYGTAEYMDASGAPLHPGRHPQEQRDRRVVRGLDLAAVPPDEARTPFASLVVSGQIWPPAVVLLRHHVVETIGGFEETLRQCEDWDLYVRSSRHGHFHFLDRPVARYRRHGSNMSDDYTVNMHYQDVVRRRARCAPENTLAQRWAAERAWRALEHRLLVRAVLAAGRTALRDPRRALPSVRTVLRHVRRLLSSPRRTPATPGPPARDRWDVRRLPGQE